MKLFVDDTRSFPRGSQCCRNAKDAKLILSLMKFDFISLDYSLGNDSENGLDILVWMKENNISVPHINIHSNHINGRMDMYEFAVENFPEATVTTNILMK